jgi:hypothetical protein
LSTFLSEIPCLRWCLAKRSQGYGAGTCSEKLLVFFQWRSLSLSANTRVHVTCLWASDRTWRHLHFDATDDVHVTWTDESLS